jgi:lipid A 3-O-deacylase
MNKTGVSALAVMLVPAAAGWAHAASGILDEAKLGIYAHDVAIGGDSREPGADVNGEVLFVSPDFLRFAWSPRPHLGLTVNSEGKNSAAYFGLTWTANFTNTIFADLGLGGAVHDGPNESSTRDHKGLGTRILFHEYLEFGYRLTPHWNAAVILDHISNANAGGHNPGLTNIGLRAGYSF